MAAPGDRLGDRYELIETIGSGGMAIVWRARDPRLRRAVAVKILRPQFAEDADFVARFESEARHAASLAHPNVATVYDTGSDPGPDGGTRYIVMELIDGPSVARCSAAGRCRRDSPSTSPSPPRGRSPRPIAAGSSIAT